MAKVKAIKSVQSTLNVDQDSGEVTARVCIEFTDSTVDAKTMSFEDYCTLFLGAKKEALSFSRLSEPSKYFYDGMVSQKEDSFKVQLLVPAGKHQMVSQHYDFADIIPYPALLFNLVFSEGRAIRKDCYAVVPDKNGRLTEDSVLYRYPYGNVSDAGSICMGSISVKCNSLTEADKFCEEFFLGIDEGHYYTPEVMISKNWNLGRLYNEVLKKEKFPTSWLVPNGRTYKDIMYK